MQILYKSAFIKATKKKPNMPPHGGKYGITSVYSHTEYAFAVFLVLYRHAPAKPSTQRQTVASAQASLHGYSSTTTERYFHGV